MNDSLRFKIVLGCLIVAALEAPQAMLQFFEDFGGPYGAAIKTEARAARVSEGKPRSSATLLAAWRGSRSSLGSPAFDPHAIDARILDIEPSIPVSMAIINDVESQRVFERSLEIGAAGEPHADR